MDKKPQIDPKDLHIGCANCSSATLKAPPDMPINVGFGTAYVEADGEIVWSETNDDDRIVTVAEAEEWAALQPEKDWRIVRYGPLHGETFQRHGPGEWVCIESNEGFA